MGRRRAPTASEPTTSPAPPAGSRGIRSGWPPTASTRTTTATPRSPGAWTPSSIDWGSEAAARRAVIALAAVSSDPVDLALRTFLTNLRFVYRILNDAIPEPGSGPAPCNDERGSGMPRMNSTMRRILAVGAASCGRRRPRRPAARGEVQLRPEHRRLVDVGNAGGAHAVPGVRQGVHEAAPRHHRQAAAGRELRRLPLEAPRPSSPATPLPMCSTSATTRSASSSTPRCSCRSRPHGVGCQPRPSLTTSSPALRRGRAGGEIFAAPNDSNPDVLWYDKPALAAAGITEDPATLAENGEWTTEKYLEMNDKLAAAGLTGRCSGTTGPRTTAGSRRRAARPTTTRAPSWATRTRPRVDAVDTLGQILPGRHLRRCRLHAEGAGADSVFVTHKAGFFSRAATRSAR